MLRMGRFYLRTPAVPMSDCAAHAGSAKTCCLELRQPAGHKHLLKQAGKVSETASSPAAYAGQQCLSLIQLCCFTVVMLHLLGPVRVSR